MGRKRTLRSSYGSLSLQQLRYVFTQAASQLEFYRSRPNVARISLTNACGSSHAAKCPPLSNSLK